MKCPLCGIELAEGEALLSCEICDTKGCDDCVHSHPSSACEEGVYACTACAGTPTLIIRHRDGVYWNGTAWVAEKKDAKLYPFFATLEQDCEIYESNAFGLDEKQQLDLEYLLDEETATFEVNGEVFAVVYDATKE